MNPTFLLALALSQISPPPLPAPPSLPPTVAFAKVENGTIQIKLFVGIPEQRRVLLTKTTADGQTVQVPTLVIEPMPYQENRTIPVAEARASTAAGKPIANDKLGELLKAETVVVLVPGESLEARYRKAFRDDVVVLSAPPVQKPVK